MSYLLNDILLPISQPTRNLGSCFKHENASFVSLTLKEPRELKLGLVGPLGV